MRDLDAQNTDDHDNHDDDRTAKDMGLTLRADWRAFLQDPEVQEKFGARSMSGVATAILEAVRDERLTFAEGQARADMEGLTEYVDALLSAAGATVDSEDLATALKVVAGLVPVTGHAKLLVNLPTTVRRSTAPPPPSAPST